MILKTGASARRKLGDNACASSPNYEAALSEYNRILGTEKPDFEGSV